MILFHWAGGGGGGKAGGWFTSGGAASDKDEELAAAGFVWRLRIRSLKTARRNILYCGETYVNSRRSILAGRRHIDQSVVVCWKKANHRVGAGGAGRLLVVVG